jgi:D-glycero-D-manno-heptose 1,7-bisphosphate phosphatase
MGVAAVERAVFLDRDGVLTQLVIEPGTGDYVSPNRVDELTMAPGVAEPLLRLTRAGFRLFIVSNQPAWAKGKTTRESLEAVRRQVDEELRSQGVTIAQAFYCYHHPNGVRPELAVRCDCRKPGVAFLMAASRTWGTDLGRSWMVGDRASDIDCGRAAGCATVLLRSPASAYDRPPAAADHACDSLAEAVDAILQQRNRAGEGWVR